MIVTDIKQDWGAIVRFDDPKDFFKQDPQVWRDLAYKKKLIIFKQMSFSIEDYVKFCLYFGRIWNEDEYIFNKEQTENVVTDKGTFTLSPFSNKLTTLANRTSSMPWHADIANPDDPKKLFCFRTLWITKNPNPEHSGFTTWLEIEDGIKFLTDEQTSMLDKVKILQQSWVYPGSLVGEYDFIKTHPITGKQSLRLNWYNDEHTKNAYITGVKINGVLQKDCSLVKEFLEHLENFPELVYQHQWDTFDIALYDNWPFVHKRSQLIFDTNLERHFYRANIDHLTDAEWAAYQKQFSK